MKKFQQRSQRKGDPVVTIVGRPNVGKSTLFNRIVGHRRSIVDKVPGITRDVIEMPVRWTGKGFLLVDTAGFDTELEDTLKERILEKIQEQIRKSDLVIFTVDARAGNTPADQVFAELLRKTGIPSILVANKIDDFSNSSLTWADEFYTLGIGEPMPISAQQGKNVGDVLDKVVEMLPIEVSEEEEENPPLHIAIVGQPNAGKSSLLNSLLGYERAIVHNEPGTTRDVIDTFITFEDENYLLLDTAGIRKRFRRGDWLEQVTISKALDVIDRADIVLLVSDLGRGLTHQDKSIAGLVAEKGKPLIMIFNKIDLVAKFEKARDAIDRVIETETQFLKNIPRIYISVLDNIRVGAVLPETTRIWKAPEKYNISTSSLNGLLQELVSSRPPTSRKGRQLKIYYATLVSEKPPVMLIFVNDTKLMLTAYKRYLENGFRKVWPYDGFPMIIKLRGKKDKE